jgi:hypothetical protein
VSEFLDELARSLSQSMPRSRALRLLGGALVSAAVPGRSPRRTAARPLAGCSPQACGSGKQVCGIPLLAGCTLACCDETFPVCCKWTGTDIVGRGGEAGLCSAHGAVPGVGEPARVVCCCPAGTRCNTSPRSAPCVPKCLDPCGPGLKHCCKSHEHCTWPRKAEGFRENGLCCPRGTVGCGKDGPGGGANWTFCCPPGQVCAGHDGTGHCAPKSR